jgi:hypothetical protein
MSVPRHVVSSQGQDAVDLARMAGLRLDEWQQFVLAQGLAEERRNHWAAFEVALIVSRQNGKGAVIEARELAGLFLLGEELIVHSAHEFKTASEGFLRILRLIQDCPSLDREVSKVRTQHGAEAIELRSGARLKFLARTGGSGRGFTGDCVILDEAHNLDDENMAALLPTLSTRPNAQVWYFSTAGMPTSTQLGAVRKRGLSGDDPSLAFFEWSADPEDDPASPETWAKTNPAMNLPGHGISQEYIARERAALAPHIFARERLGIGQYPLDRANAWQVIRKDDWDRGRDSRSQTGPGVAFAVDVTPDRSSAVIGVASKRRDGLLHVEVAMRDRGTAWIVKEIARMADQYDPVAVVIHPAYPAGSLIDDIEAAGVMVTRTTARDVAQACGQFYDAATDTQTLRHLGQDSLNAAVAGAQRRQVGDVWSWDRQALTVDISPLVAVTLAAWGLEADMLAPDDVGIY